MDIISGLEAAAARHGAKIALRMGESALSYADLAAGSRSLAAALVRRGIGEGDAIAVLCDNSLELLQLYYAAARLGAVFVPVNPALSAREVAYIAAHVGSSLLLHDEAHAATAEGAVAADRRLPLATLLAGLGSGAAAHPARDHAADDFLVIYTSGSTGVPKGVVFDQAGEMAGNRSLAELWGIGPQDVTLVTLPLGFLYGLSTAAATGIQAEGEVVVMRRFHPGEVLAALIERKATVYHGVPTMFAMMLDYAEEHGLQVDLSGVRLMISAGAPLSGELRRRFAARFNKAIDDYYALTEARPIFGRPSAGGASIPEGAIGRPAPGVAVRIVDGAGAEVPAGEVGEILVRAPAMLKRYHLNEEMTRQALVDGWFRTGDLGRRDGEGNYYLTGRVKDIIIRGGANVAPAEVEAVLAGHPAVQSAAVVGVPHQTLGEVPVAFLVLRSKMAVCMEELKAFCAQRLAEFKRPAEFVVLAAHPLGPTGKVDKKALKQQWLERARQNPPSRGR
jgi:long-chain acyl-CoA synthetase